MKKFIVALILVAVLAGCIWADEDGSNWDKAYVISSYDDFIKYRSSLNSGEEKYYKLNCDLQLTKLDELIAPVYTLYGERVYYTYSGDTDIVINERHVTIEIYADFSSTFRGHFDGQGHTIYVNLRPQIIPEARETLATDSLGRVTIERLVTRYSHRSLFGAIEVSNNEPAVNNLHVGGRMAGGFLGAGITSTLNSGKIINCNVSCDIEISTITNNEDLELHKIHAGGIAANMYGGSIESCDFSGNITTSGGEFFSYAGGIVGAMAAGNITGCTVKHYSVITAEGNSGSERSQSAGGITGYLEVDALYANDSSDVTVTECMFEGGEISGGTNAGGIVGTLYGGLIADNTVSDDTRITAGNNAGGIVGLMGAGAAVYDNSVMGGYVQADSRSSGGIAGLLELGEIRDNYSQAAIRGNAPNQGGVVGEIHNHYGTSGNVTGNRYMGSGYAIGLDEEMRVNVTGDNTPIDDVLYFEGNSTLTATENTRYDHTITMSLPAFVSTSDMPSWMSLVQSGKNITLSGIPTSIKASSFTLTASYGYQTVSRIFTVNINPQLYISADNTVQAKIGDYLEISFSAYATSFDVSNASFSWSVVDSRLPSGLYLNESAGIISGDVSEAGTFDITIQATPENVSLNPVSKTITINIEPDFTITTESLISPVKAGREYSCAIETDSDLPLLWSVSSGSLPDGITLGTLTGYLSGTPTTAGEYSFTVIATTGTVSADKEFTLTIEPSITITTDSLLPYALLGKFYSQDISHDVASGNLVQWTLSRDLPRGLSFDSGTIAGIVDDSPDMAGDYSFSIWISAGEFTDSKDFELKVVGLFFSPDVLPSVTVGEEYSHDLRKWLNVYGVSEDLAFFSADVSSLPAGLSLDEDGLISGVPSEAGTYDFTVSALLYSFSVSKNCTVTVNPVMLVKVPSVWRANVKAGNNITDCVFTLSQDVGPVTWSLGGSYPDGLTIGSLTGELSGTVTTPGVYTFTVLATYGAMTAETELTLTVDPALTITTDSQLPSAITGQEYTLTLSHDAPAGNTVTWTKLSGDLPGGFTFSNDGTISGSTDVTGSYEFRVIAAAGTYSASKDFVLTVVETVPDSGLSIVNAGNFPERLKSGQQFSYTFTTNAENKNTVYWSVSSGTLPAGLTLGSLTGELSGTPSEAGTYTFTIQAANGSASSEYTITLIVDPALTITTDSLLPSATAGTEYYALLEHDAPDGNNVVWTLAGGSLPVGFTLSNDGTISGTTSSTGEYAFRVIATAGYYTASKDFALTVLSPGSSGGTTSNDSTSTVTSNDSTSTVTSNDSASTVTSNDASQDITIPDKDQVDIKSSSLPDGLIGESYRAVLVANPEGVRWTQSGGIIPPGLTMSNDGVISGVPSVVGDFYFNATASHESCRPSTVELGIKITRSQSGTTAHSSGGGGGGCNSGGFIGVMLAGIVALKLRKQ